jgi:hypothetical protein
MEAEAEVRSARDTLPGNALGRWRYQAPPVVLASTRNESASP